MWYSLWNPIPSSAPPSMGSNRGRDGIIRAGVSDEGGPPHFPSLHTCESTCRKARHFQEKKRKERRKNWRFRNGAEKEREKTIFPPKTPFFLSKKMGIEWMLSFKKRRLFSECGPQIRINSGITFISFPTAARFKTRRNLNDLFLMGKEGALAAIDATSSEEEFKVSWPEGIGSSGGSSLGSNFTPWLPCIICGCPDLWSKSWLRQWELDRLGITLRYYSVGIIRKMQKTLWHWRR